jgi:hypothetical protein
MISLVAASVVGITIAMAVSQSCPKTVGRSLAMNFFVILGFDFFVYPLISLFVIYIFKDIYFNDKKSYISEIVIGREMIQIYVKIIDLFKQTERTTSPSQATRKS